MLSFLVVTLGLLWGCEARSQTQEPTTAVLTGVVCNVFLDDVDENTIFIALNCDGKMTYAYRQGTDAANELPRLRQYIGCKISAISKEAPVDNTFLRKHLHTLHLIPPHERITILEPPEHAPFDVPSLRDDPPDLSEIDSCGKRKITGIVIAKWHKDICLVATDYGESVQVQFQYQDLPELYSSIEAVGKVESNLYRYGLILASWRKAHSPTPNNQQSPNPKSTIPETVNIPDLFTSGNQYAIDTKKHGKLITICGTLKSFLPDEEGLSRFLVDDGGYKIVVDCSAMPEAIKTLQEESKLMISGICVLQSENWHSDIFFPKVSGLFVVPRTSDDIVVIKRPPWWTTLKLFVVVISLFFVLIAILAWNIALRAIVARKSKSLLKEQALKLSETIKVDERTRLAAELHDFHSQNLTAIAYQISAAQDACSNAQSETTKCLSIAGNMLRSCRTELRRCLWDLRNEVLDLPDFAEAIRLTVGPVSGDAKLSVRFTGLRSQISDSFAHTIISILRELSANASNHGHAKTISIAGEQRQHFVRFSIRDDGIGFDPSQRPDQNDGHLGLDGIQERIRRFGGTFEIQSRPGSGTYIRFSMQQTIITPK